MRRDDIVVRLRMAADKPFSEALTMALSEALSEPHYVHNDERAAGTYGMSAGLSAIQLVAAGMMSRTLQLGRKHRTRARAKQPSLRENRNSDSPSLSPAYRIRSECGRPAIF